MIAKLETVDLSFVVRSLQNMRNEIAACAEVDDDYAYVMNSLVSMQSTVGFIGLVDEDHRGFIFGCLSRSWYDKRIKAYEQLLYVAPEFRTSSLGSRLITEFCKEARARDAVEVIAGTSLGFKKDAVVALYKRKGFTPMGESLSLKIE